MSRILVQSYALDLQGTEEEIEQFVQKLLSEDCVAGCTFVSSPDAETITCDECGSDITYGEGCEHARQFNPGTRVKLLPFEDQPEEFGQIEGGPDNGVYLVRIDEKYRGDDDPDGLREVTPDQIVKL